MVTKIKDLKKYAGGSEVELPGFIADEPFIAKLKRPSMMKLVEAGDIPNPLLNAAAKLFKDGVNQAVNDGKNLKEISQVFCCVAKAALVEPTYEDLEAAGVGLTDAQLLYIYNFTQTGVDTLKVFRDLQEPEPDNKPVGNAGTGAE